MNKFNKKGFTLIEMLVVIAIIAVLVSIIIPTVTSATDKAAAATNAANLRSLVAEATTKYLTNDSSTAGNVAVVIDADGVPTATVTENAPLSKKVGNVGKDLTAELEWNTNKAGFDAYYGDVHLDVFTQAAAGEIDPRTVGAAE